MKNGTFNNYTKWSKNWGGVRKAYEGHEAPWMLTGGFKFPSLNVLPLSGNVLPAFTPVMADEQARTIVPLYVFEVAAVDSVAKTISVVKNEEGTRARVGMKLIVTPGSLNTAAAVDAVATVSAIDSSDASVDVLTVDNAVGTVGGTLVEAGDNRKIKVVPNTLIPYDTCVDEDAYALDGEAVWGATSPILERRIPPIPAIIKQALKDAGCVFRFSNKY